MDPLLPPAALALGLAVSLAVWGFRDPKADEHDLSDYREPAPVNTAPRSLARWEQVDRQSDDILPPAPADLTDVPWKPPYAMLVVAQSTRRYGDSPADIAARFLRELRDEAKAGAR